jgi:hypothetical protein
MILPPVALAALAVGLVGLITLWVGLPLWRGELPEEAADPATVALLSEREAVLADLRDLDAARNEGRVTESDYAELRGELMARGAAALQSLDRLAATTDGASVRLAEAIEADVRAAAQSDPNAAAAVAPLESRGA